MKKVTMSDIAKKANVSKATVSMVINNRDVSIRKETRDRILTICEELNYIPNGIARSLSTSKSGTLGIILPDITNPFFSEMARAIEDGASDLGYNVIFCNTDNEQAKEEKYTTLLISKLVDGVIFISGGESSKCIDKLKSNGVPYIMVDRPVKSDENNYGIYCNNKDGVKMGIRYLISKNKKNIVFVEGSSRLENTKERFYGYKEVMQEHNLYNKSLVFQGDFNIESGIEVTKDIIKKLKNIDAIFYSNDVMAYGGMKVLLRNGYKIPEDISIMGFDNINISKFIEPELTTISQPIYSMGRKACEMIIKLINKEENINKKVYFDTELIIRKTV